MLDEMLSDEAMSEEAILDEAIWDLQSSIIQCIYENIQNPCSETLEYALKALGTVPVDFFATHPESRAELVLLLQRTYYDERMTASCRSASRTLIDRLFECYDCNIFEFHNII